MSDYWEDRAAWDMYERMEEAEKTADLIAKVYRNASMHLTYAASDIFERYMKKHRLSETDAWNLINTMQDRTSLDELMQALKNKDPDKDRKELLAELEAPAYRARMDRLKELLLQVDTVMTEVYHQEQQFDTSFFENLSEQSYYHSVYNIQKQTGLGFSFARVSKKQVQQAVTMNWSGTHFSKRIWKNTEELSETLKEELLVSILTGRTERETAEVIRKRCGGGAMQARRLVRTESCFLNGELNAMAYEECEIEKYRYLATLDLRTSEICRSLDGKIFPLSERKAGKNYPPMHPWCRSTTISVTDEETLARMKRRAYNPATGRLELVPATMTYQEWYKKYVEGKPEAEAQEKAIKNASSDRKQFRKYQEILGKENLKSFVQFQKMKYNEPEKWKKLYTDYMDAKLQQRIRSDEYNKQIEEGKQGKHIIGHNNYTEGRSYLTVSVEEAQELVNKYAGTGKIQRDRQNVWNNKETVDVGKDVGVWISKDGTYQLPTGSLTIHYSKKGTHIVPAMPKGAEV